MRILALKLEHSVDIHSFQITMKHGFKILKSVYIQVNLLLIFVK